MDIDRCNSIFELFTAFNFTYAVLSNTNKDSLQKDRDSKGFSYVELIDNQLLRSYTPNKDFFEGAKTLENNIVMKKKSCKDGMAIEEKKENHNKEILKRWTDIISKFDGLGDQTKTWNEEIGNTKMEAITEINERFPYISFLSALFCIAVLGIAASEADYKHFSLLLLDFLVITLTVQVIKKKDSISYPHIIKRFSFWLIFLIVIHFGIKIFYENLNDNICTCITYLDRNSIWKSLLIMGNILIPFWHFIYYYFRLSSKFGKIKKENENSLNLLNKTYRDLSTNYNTLTNQNI